MKHTPRIKSFVLTMLAIFGLCAVALTTPSCITATPSPIATTQPTADQTKKIVADFDAYRKGYLATLIGITADRSIGKMTDEHAQSLELWRLMYVSTVLTPKALAAQPYIDPDLWAALASEQAADESAWANALAKKPAPPANTEARSILSAQAKG